MPESNFKGEIGNFQPDSDQELPGGFPETNFKGKIGNFLPYPSQELPGGLPKSNFKGKIDNFPLDLRRSSQEASQRAILRMKSVIFCQILARTLPREQF